MTFITVLYLIQLNGLAFELMRKNLSVDYTICKDLAPAEARTHNLRIISTAR